MPGGVERNDKMRDGEFAGCTSWASSFTACREEVCVPHAYSDSAATRTWCSNMDQATCEDFGGCCEWDGYGSWNTMGMAQRGARRHVVVNR